MEDNELAPLYFAGLDLGQSKDYTALAVLEQSEADEGRMYALRHLHRWPLGTSYPRIVDDVVGLFAHPPLAGATLAVDQTGTGRPVVDMLRRGRPSARLRPILITAGHEVVSDQGGYRVPKKELASALQVVLQSRRLKIAKSLPDAAVLVRELENFRVKITAAGNETFEAWRERDHDDLVLAAAMAAWLGERSQRMWVR